VSGRYDSSGFSEGQFEPGSNDRVLRNLRGIVDPVEMDRLEAAELARTLNELINEVDREHRFVAADVCRMHAQWLRGIYNWAGDYRSVNLQKDGFPFAAASLIDGLMAALEAGALRRHTPCRFPDVDAISGALAEVHVELVLIHPFRDGNGRISRVLATLMALQAGLPLLDFSLLAGEAKSHYFAAIQAGMDRNYAAMRDLFAKIISATTAGRK
jgi:cell filamentation protein